MIGRGWRWRDIIGTTVEIISHGVRRGIEVRGTNGLMMRCRVIFGEIIGTVCFAFAPIDFELALANAIANPLEAHTNGLGLFMFHGISGDAAFRFVVGCHWGCRLGMPHFFKGNAQSTGFLAVEKERAEFGFGGAGKNFAHDVAKDLDGTVGPSAEHWECRVHS